MNLAPEFMVIKPRYSKKYESLWECGEVILVLVLNAKNQWVKIADGISYGKTNGMVSLMVKP